MCIKKLIILTGNTNKPHRLSIIAVIDSHAPRVPLIL